MAEKKATDFSAFMRKNKITKENVKYRATKSLVDKKGEALEWEFKHLTAKENSFIIEEATTHTSIKGSRGYTTSVNQSKYVNKLITKSVVYPDLNNAELQDSYGVMNSEELLLAIVDDVGEYTALSQFVSELNGFSAMEDRIEEVKN